MARERLKLEYIRLSVAAGWEWQLNPKLHDMAKIKEAIVKYGFQKPPKFDPTLNDSQGGLVYGNGRTKALVELQAEGVEIPAGIMTAKDDGEWCVPVVFGIDASSQTAAMRLAVDHNNLTLAGGVLNGLDAAKMYDIEGYNRVLDMLKTEEAVPVTVSNDELDLLLSRVTAATTIVENGDNGVGNDIFAAAGDAFAAMLAGNEDTGSGSDDDDDEGGELGPDDDGDEGGETKGQGVVEAANTVVMIGKYNFPMGREEFLELEESIRQMVGFGKGDVETELQRRLGLYEIIQAGQEA
ncbi:MAG: hypothetical protein FOGNACKC_00896 [Anaerolineae bacterium]|nr:hypothetical protein [Anaerolineae bacterium]